MRLLAQRWSESASLGSLDLGDGTSTARSILSQALEEELSDEDENPFGALDLSFLTSFRHYFLSDDIDTDFLGYAKEHDVVTALLSNGVVEEEEHQPAQLVTYHFIRRIMDNFG